MQTSNYNWNFYQQKSPFLLKLALLTKNSTFCLKHGLLTEILYETDASVFENDTLCFK